MEIKTEDAPEYRTVSPDDEKIIAQALSILERHILVADVLTSPANTRNYLRLKYGRFEHEVFGLILLNNQHKVIAILELFKGTINGVNVYPREVIKEVLRHNANAVILFHNHPSGILEPSPADRNITTRLKEALALIDVRVLDHVIVSVEGSYSFADHGLI